MPEGTRSLIGPQERTLEALRELLDTTGAEYRLDRNSDHNPAVYELRFAGKHWGFIGLNYDGSLELI